MLIDPLIIGHRGASATAPENTLVAFERAFVDGADGIEFDVQLARDLIPVVIHDASLRRTGLREESVASLSSTDLGRIDVGTWFNIRHPANAQPAFANERIATLAQVFEFTRQRAAVLYVELKCTAQDYRTLATEVARLVREFSLIDRVVIKSFTHAAITEIKRLDSEIRTAALFEPKLSRPLPTARMIIAAAQQCGANEISVYRTLATRRVLEAARWHKLKTVVWTIDHPAWLKRERANDIDAVITNKPALMRARLDQLRDE